MAHFYLARVAELADAPDLGSGGQPWGFKSLHAHEKEQVRIRTCSFCFYTTYFLFNAL